MIGTAPDESVHYFEEIESGMRKEREMAKYTMLWQSSTVIDGMPAYKEAIEAHGKKILGPDVGLKVRGVKKGTSDIHYLAFVNLLNTL